MASARHVLVLTLVAALVAVGSCAEASGKEKEDAGTRSHFLKQAPQAFGFVFQLILLVGVVFCDMTCFSVGRRVTLVVLAVLIKIPALFMLFSLYWAYAFQCLVTSAIGIIGAVRKDRKLLHVFTALCILNVMFILFGMSPLFGGSDGINMGLVDGLKYTTCKQYFCGTATGSCDSYCLPGWQQFVRLNLMVLLYLFFVLGLLSYLSTSESTYGQRQEEDWLEDGWDKMMQKIKSKPVEHEGPTMPEPKDV